MIPLIVAIGAAVAAVGKAAQEIDRASKKGVNKPSWDDFNRLGGGGNKK